MHSSPKIIDLDFAKIEIYPKFLTSTIQEGVVFGIKHLEKINSVFQEHYPNQKFGYISNRKFDYSVDPICYLESDRFTHLTCIAIWCHNETNLNTTEIEKNFNKKPFEAFYTFEECKNWVEQILHSN